MGWLDRLDRRTAQWPTSLHGLYLAVKWLLAAFGGFAILRLWLDRTGLWPLFDRTS